MGGEGAQRPVFVLVSLKRRVRTGVYNDMGNEHESQPGKKKGTRLSLQPGAHHDSNL